MPQLNFDFFLSCPILYSMAAAILGFLIMESIARLGIVLVGTRAFGEGDSYIAAGIGSVFGALLGCSGLYGNFLPIFQAVISILILSGIIQVILTLPIFIKKLINNKNWPTLNSLIIFAVYSVAYLFAQNSNLLNNQLLYWSGTILLLLIGLYTCRKLIYGIQENDAKGALYLPFGPAMIIASFIALFTMGF